MNKDEFIARILPGALEAYRKYNILPSLTLAQSALESNWGKSGIGNNLFGIKATSSWTGKKQYVWTTEYMDGKPIKVQDWFRDYDSIDDSILDHAKLLSYSRYKPVREAKDYKEACYRVQQCGYATDIAYAQKLISIIETYKF
jgi:lysozyme